MPARVERGSARLKESFPPAKRLAPRSFGARDTGRVLLIVCLVGGGFWFAKYHQDSHASSDESPIVTTTVQRASWSPDGNRLLAESRSARGGHGCVAVHNLSRPAEKVFVDTENEPLSALEFSRDGGHALVGTFFGHLWWIDLASGERTTLIDLAATTGITSAALSPDGRFAVATSYDGQAILVRLPEKDASVTPSNAGSESLSGGLEVNVEPAVLWHDPHRRPDVLGFSDSSDLMIWSIGHDRVSIRETATGRGIHTFDVAAFTTRAVFLARDREIALAGVDDMVRIWEIETGNEVWREPSRCFGVLALARSPDGKKLAWGGFARTVIVWNAEERRIEREIETPMATVSAVGYSPDGRRLAVAGRDPAIRIYDVATGVECRAVDVGGLP